MTVGRRGDERANSHQIRIVVVDDHGLFRAGMIELLSSIDGFTVEGEGSSGEDALEAAETLHPNVILLDIAMPGPGLGATILGVRSASPVTAVVVVTMFDEPRLIREAVSAGASGYLLKSSRRSQLAAAVRLAAESLRSRRRSMS